MGFAKLVTSCSIILLINYLNIMNSFVKSVKNGIAQLFYSLFYKFFCQSIFRVIYSVIINKNTK